MQYWSNCRLSWLCSAKLNLLHFSLTQHLRLAEFCALFFAHIPAASICSSCKMYICFQPRTLPESTFCNPCLSPHNLSTSKRTPFRYAESKNTNPAAGMLSSFIPQAADLSACSYHGCVVLGGGLLLASDLVSLLCCGELDDDSPFCLQWCMEMLPDSPMIPYSTPLHRMQDSNEMKLASNKLNSLLQLQPLYLSPYSTNTSRQSITAF